jgi:hypothetical protein
MLTGVLIGWPEQMANILLSVAVIVASLEL